MTPPPNLPAGYELLPAPFLRLHGAVEGMKERPKACAGNITMWRDSKNPAREDDFVYYDFIAPLGSIAAATTPLPEHECNCGGSEAVKYIAAGHYPDCARHRRYRHILPGELAKMPTKPEGLVKASRSKNDWHEVATWPLIQRFVDGVYDFAYAIPLPPQPEKGKGGARGNPLHYFPWDHWELQPDSGVKLIPPTPTAADAATHALTDEDIRIRIAEWCGWKEVRLYPSLIADRPWLGGIDPRPDTLVEIIDAQTGESRTPTKEDYQKPTNVPAYTTSLDAIASAEARLTREQCNAYNTLLMEGKPPRSEMTCEAEKWSWHSSARIRSLALLRIINSKNSHEQ